MRPEERPLAVQGSPWLRAVKQTGPQPCNPREQNSNNNLNNLWADSSLEPPDRKAARPTP